jgi:hypothetical protein
MFAKKDAKGSAKVCAKNDFPNWSQAEYVPRNLPRLLPRVLPRIGTQVLSRAAN